ncbi:MAG: hypothetical protein HN849_12585, partial [Victivallales bacterium]|nr:hypothetical protein [Victivallales bacterium]
MRSWTVGCFTAICCCVFLPEQAHGQGNARPRPPFHVWVSEGKALAEIVTDDFTIGKTQPADLLNEY